MALTETTFLKGIENRLQKIIEAQIDLLNYIHTYNKVLEERENDNTRKD